MSFMTSCRSQAWWISWPAGKGALLIVFAESPRRGAGKNYIIGCDADVGWQWDREVRLPVLQVRNWLWDSGPGGSTCLPGKWFAKHLYLRQLWCLHLSVCMSSYLLFFFGSTFCTTWITSITWSVFTVNKKNTLNSLGSLGLHGSRQLGSSIKSPRMN